MSQSKAYQRTKLVLGLVSMAAGWAYLLVLVLTHLAASLVSATQIVTNAYLHFLLFSLAAGLIAQVYALPLAFLGGYVVEHRYQLSNQTVVAWAREQLKGTLVAAVIGVPLALIFYACLRIFGSGWWLPVGGVMIVFSLVIARLAPTLIFPLFYRFDPLPANHPVRWRIEELCRSVGLGIEGVFRFNLSKTTKKANAAFTGLGASKRVLLADTLLDNFSDHEILAVTAHELGHFKLNHLWKGMALGVVITFVGLYIVAKVHTGFTSGEVASLATLPWLALLLGLYSFTTTPVSNAYSRRSEFAADKYSEELLGNGRDLASGLERLAELNLADRDPHPVVEFLFHSHPSIKKRVAALGSQGVNPPDPAQP